ncbi:MAG TPA: EF-hand domain-containing protein [Luteimonas sp.]|nr:EF-hand domain-containing protein [Luteimonas sp.]
MNRLALLTLALAAAGVSAAALAQTPGHDGARHHRAMKGMHGGGIATLDKDQDGRIARAELSGEGRRMARLAQQFDAIDANRDGYLVRTEVEAWRKAMWDKHSAEFAKRHAEHFAKADLNKDGRLSKVEVQEAMPRMAGRFAWLDDNRDGYLDRNEVQPMRGIRAP